MFVYLQDCSCLASQAQLAGILLRREGPQFLSKDGKLLRSSIWLIRPYVFSIYSPFLSSAIPETMKDELERIYRRAGSRKLWSEIHTYTNLFLLFHLQYFTVYPRTSFSLKFSTWRITKIRGLTQWWAIIMPHWVLDLNEEASQVVLETNPQIRRLT